MKTEGRRGLAFIVPDSPADRRALGEALLELARCDDEEVAEIYRRLVPICLTGVRYGPGNVVLLSRAARVVTSATWTPEDARPPAFPRRFEELLAASPGACRVRTGHEPRPLSERRLPFGTVLPGYVRGCSDVGPAEEEPEAGLEVACGMTCLSGEGREFLTFLTR